MEQTISSRQKFIAHWLLSALIISLGFGQLLRIEVGLATIFPHDLFALFALLLLPLPRQFPRWVKLIFSGLAIGWLRAFTLFELPNLAIPALYSLRLLTYLILYLSVSQAKPSIPRWPFLASGTITLVIAATQYFFMPDMRWAQYLGWDDHLNRVTLPHFDPTYTAVMLILFLFVLNFRTLYGKTLLVAGAFLALMTYSRSVLISMAAAQIVVLKNFLFLLLVIIFGLITTAQQPGRFGEGTNLLRTYSISSRLDHDLNLTKSLGPLNLVLGTGYNTLPLTLSTTQESDNHATSANNTYLTILATMGIIGIAGWILLLYSLYQQGNQSSVLFLIFASFFNNVLLYPFALLWILLITNVKAPTAT